MTRASAARAAATTLSPDDVVLVIEVVSPSSWRTDHNDKREMYAAWGIARYWIVDHAPEPRVTVLRLNGDRYTEDANGGVLDTLQLARPFPARLRLGHD